MLIELYKRHLLRIILSMAILAFFLLHVSGRFTIGALDGLELFAYDQRLRLTSPNTVDDRIVIIDIDEESLAVEGRWPWSRDRLELLLDQLFDKYGIAIIGFDVVWAEEDQSSGLGVLQALAEDEFSDDPRFVARIGELDAELDYDERFMRSMKDRAVILGFTFNAQGTQAGVLPPPVFGPGSFRGRNIAFKVADGFAGNLEKFQRVAHGAGHFNPLIDPDGIVRRIPMLYEYEGAYYEALSLAVARAVLEVREITPGYAKKGKSSKYGGLEWLQLGDFSIPVDGSVSALVPYRGRQQSYPYISAKDVIAGTADPAGLEGRVALLGTSAPGLLDLRATPLDAVYPGVEIHANMIAGILDQTVKEAPEYTLGAEFILVLLSGLFMALLLPLLSPLLGTVATVVLLGAVIGANLIIWSNFNLVLPIASGVVILFVMYLFNVTYALFVETRGKRELAGLFGQYVPPELVDEMSEDPQAYSLESENRELTVLFSDVRSFTTISEGLEPAELSQLMNEYLTPMTRIIHEHRGTIDKYMGDAIMAFWGAPINDAEHARHALDASMAMLAELKVIQKDFEKRGWPPIRIGIGLNTGPMNVGNMGSAFRMAYTVLGDAVNLGSRLEGLTKGYVVELIVNESTAAAVPEYIYRELDRVRVKGKDKPVTIYEPVGLRKDVEKPARDEIKLYEQALKLYRNQEWDMAELQFLNLHKSHPERSLYKLYSERITVYRKEPPPKNWDGVWTHETK